MELLIKQMTIDVNQLIQQQKVQKLSALMSLGISVPTLGGWGLSFVRGEVIKQLGQVN